MDIAYEKTVLAGDTITLEVHDASQEIGISEPYSYNLLRLWASPSVEALSVSTSLPHLPTEDIVFCNASDPQGINISRQVREAIVRAEHLG